MNFQCTTWHTYRIIANYLFLSAHLIHKLFWTLPSTVFACFQLIIFGTTSFKSVKSLRSNLQHLTQYWPFSHSSTFKSVIDYSTKKNTGNSPGGPPSWLKGRSKFDNNPLFHPLTALELDNLSSFGTVVRTAYSHTEWHRRGEEGPSRPNRRAS